MCAHLPARGGLQLAVVHDLRLQRRRRRVRSGGGVAACAQRRARGRAVAGQDCPRPERVRSGSALACEELCDAVALARHAASW